MLMKIYEEKDSEFKRIFFEKIREEVWDDRSNEIHATDLANICLRRAYYQKKYPEMMRLSDEEILRVWIGWKLHTTQITEKHEVSFEYEDVMGSMDEIHDGWIVDKKFVRWIPKEPHDHYIRQMKIYLYNYWKVFGEKLKGAKLFYVDVNRLKVKVFVIEMETEEDWNELVEWYEKLRDEFKKCLENDSPPPMTECWLCQKCPYNVFCYPVNKEVNE